MTKKNFIALADAIKDRRLSSRALDVCSNFAEPFSPRQLELLANFCESQNPAFNRARWLGYIAGTNGKNGGAL